MRTAIIAALGLLTTSLGAPAYAKGESYPSPITIVNGDFRDTSKCVGALFPGNDLWKMNSRCKVEGKYVATNTVPVLGCGKILLNDANVFTCIPDHNILMQHMALKNLGAFRSAGVIVFGKDPSWTDVRTWYLWGYSKYSKLQAEGVDFTDAALVLRDYLKTAATKKERDAVMMEAVTQVFGPQTPKPGQIFVPAQYDAAKYDADMKAGKAWYSSIVIDLRKPKPTAPTSTTSPPPIH